MSTKNEPQLLQVVHTGSINASIVHPREVMKALVISNCSCCVVAHNHPSNDVTPSPEDIDVTNRLVEAGKIIGIDVMDHLILASDKFISLKERLFVRGGSTMNAFKRLAKVMLEKYGISVPLSEVGTELYQRCKQVQLLFSRTRCRPRGTALLSRFYFTRQAI